MDRRPSGAGREPGNLATDSARRIEAEHLDWALKDSSGYIAADELYDGPFCILSIVDKRTFKRIAYQVLRRDPGRDDITAFFRRFRAALDPRGLACAGSPPTAHRCTRPPSPKSPATCP